MVFQHFNLFPHKCVLDNVTLTPMLTKGMARPAAQKPAMELLDMCAAVAYSEPALCDAEAFALKKGNPLKLMSYKDIADNADVKIGAPDGGTEEKLALEAGVPRDRVIVVPDGQSGLKMLQDGRIDVYSLPVLSITI
ncbi:Arginine transport ATP-binding protein ArtM [Ensifer adhaerens]|uniref:ABC-type sugar transport system ATPase subunit n=1 Tax=Ensifer adhaerens TaxID=106592 RepID=A0ACC5T5V7_ENSAD|nr:ABC-type sugar transport system ATPase subunit [Ensifer adhaerens]NRP22057.1 Arginine transport ATP-binding protein ArtM [Ensifer adhaerens]